MPKPSHARETAKAPSSLVDRQLARYREMRNFDSTPEPRGGKTAPSRKVRSVDLHQSFPFVIQKHAARRLHYDFRLGLHGVLKSWAVTKGPSYVPADKRLAVEVEDHPIEYGGFEGTIPQGQYGGGTVMLWDQGAWEPIGDPDEGLAKGNLKFILHGEKLRGKWVLVRMKNRSARESKPNWLLIKEHDEYERASQDPAVTDDEPLSAATGRDLEAIAQDRDHVWQSNRPEKLSAPNGLRKNQAPFQGTTGRPGLSALAAANGPKSKGLQPLAPAIRVTHGSKIIDPETGLTKQALIDYYLAVADSMLPHIAGRPLSLVRCPNGLTAGMEKDCFFQKKLGRGMPAGVEGVTVPNKTGNGSETYVTVSTPEALAGLAQMNVLEVHPWGSKSDDLEHPDRLIFDLDPDDAVSWPTLAESAREIRRRLQDLGLESFLKSTGGKGLHVVAPIRPVQQWDAVKEIAHAIALWMENENGKLYITKMTKSARKNKIFIDYLRNERGATAIAPYSSRARPGMAVAIPLMWAELNLPARPRFRVADFSAWRSRLRRNPWKAMAALDQTLPVLKKTRAAG